MNEQTFFFTANAYMKRNILQSARMAELLIEVLYSYRTQGRFFVHDFVVMPDPQSHGDDRKGRPVDQRKLFISR